ncbi:UNVERIFIED_CONTAM: hypothetical protein Sradi_2064200 [Sesamum radiatum]|uniref:GST N-terminal domain-containing protein n=1 Tax=Sesamum radiatum TaxID=300843 RepID=A0AAW2THV3_SESRA
MAACCTGRTTPILNTTSFVETLGTSQLGSETPDARSPIYAILRYLPLTLHSQKLYASRAIVEHVMRHATHQTEEGSMCHPSDAELGGILTERIPLCRRPA